MSQSNATTRFKLPPKPQPATGENPAGDGKRVEEFIQSAALADTITRGRGLKPMRLNLELDVEVHRRLKIHAVERGISVAKLIRGLIDQELSR